MPYKIECYERQRQNRLIQVAALVALQDPYCQSGLEITNNIPSICHLKDPESDKKKLDTLLTKLKGKGLPSDPIQLYEIARKNHEHRLRLSLKSGLNYLEPEEINILYDYDNIAVSISPDQKQISNIRQSISMLRPKSPLNAMLLNYLSHVSKSAPDLDLNRIKLNFYLDVLLSKANDPQFQKDESALDKIFLLKSDGSIIIDHKQATQLLHNTDHCSIPPEILYTVETQIFFLTHRQTINMLRCINLLLKLEEKFIKNPDNRPFTQDFMIFGGYESLYGLARGVPMSESAHNIMASIYSYTPSFDLNDLIGEIITNYFDIECDDEREPDIDSELEPDSEPDGLLDPDYTGPYSVLLQMFNKNDPSTNPPYNFLDLCQETAISIEIIDPHNSITYKVITYGQIYQMHFVENLCIANIAKFLHTNEQTIDDIIRVILQEYLNSFSNQP